MKRIFLSAALCAFPLVAFGQDARMSYKTVSGDYASVSPISTVCSVDENGVPQLCADGIAGGSGSGSGIFTYKTPSGKLASVQPVVPVCSLSSTGIPEICDFSSGGSTITPGLVVGDSQAVTSNGTWPTTDPLVAGQAWQSGGAMMLSTGSAAKPTFDGSGLKNVAVLNASGQVTSPLATTSASSTGALGVAGSLTVTNTGASMTGNVSGSTKKWTLGRRPQDTYTSLQSYNGSSWQHLTLNDDGSVETSLGHLANLGADAAFSGLVSAATLKSTGDAEFAGNISLDNGKAMTFHGPSGTTSASSYMYGDSSGNISVSGSMAIPTLTVSTAATVPDVAVNNSSTSALNTESADKRYIAITDESNFIDSETLSKYVDRATIASTYLAKSDASTTYAPLASPALTGTPTAPTPATTDNSTTVATTAFVNNAFNAIEYSVQGDISTSGSSIQIPFGTSGLYAKFAYTGSGSASMTFCSTSGTLSPVDIRRNSIWGGSGVETYTLDNGSVSTSCVTADSTVYTQSQDSSAYFIRVSGTIYFLTVWASNNGARAFMGVHKMI